MLERRVPVEVSRLRYAILFVDCGILNYHCHKSQGLLPLPDRYTALERKKAAMLNPALSLRTLVLVDRLEPPALTILSGLLAHDRPPSSLASCNEEDSEPSRVSDSYRLATFFKNLPAKIPTTRQE